MLSVWAVGSKDQFCEIKFAFDSGYAIILCCPPGPLVIIPFGRPWPLSRGQPDSIIMHRRTQSSSKSGASGIQSGASGIQSSSESGANHRPTLPSFGIQSSRNLSRVIRRPAPRHRRSAAHPQSSSRAIEYSLSLRLGVRHHPT